MALSFLPDRDEDPSRHVVNVFLSDGSLDSCIYLYKSHFLLVHLAKWTWAWSGLDCPCMHAMHRRAVDRRLLYPHTSMRPTTHVGSKFSGTHPVSPTWHPSREDILEPFPSEQEIDACI